MYKRFIAFMAVLWSFFPSTAKAAPPALQQIDNDDFTPTWVSHEPGSKTIVVYGISSRTGTAGFTDLARLKAEDNGVSNSYSFAWVTGVNTAAQEISMLKCPMGSFCSGKALYRTSLGAISKCTLVGDAMSGCSNLPSFVAGETLALTTSKIIAQKSSDNRLYLVDPITGASTPMSAACSPAGKTSYPAGGLAGGFLYLSSDRAGTIGSHDLFRIPSDGLDCSGSAVNLMEAGYFKSASPSTDDASINTVGVDHGAVDPLSGAVYYIDWTTDFPFVAKKEKLCDDGFIEGLDEPGGEECDGAAKDVYGALPDHDKWRLNGQTCLTIPGGFTGGTLKCHPKGHPQECKFNTSSCTLAASCGDGVKNGSESCDGSDLGGASCTSVPGGFSGGTLACSGSCNFNTSGCYKCGDGVINPGEVCDGTSFGGATCASIKGAGWTGSLTCSSCASVDSSACVAPPPSCGDLTCNGSENCSNCPGDCGACAAVCGDGIKNGSDSCDGSDLGGASCTSVPGGFSGGTLACSSSCIFNTSGCYRCGDGTINPGEVCDGASFGGATCASIKGAGWTGSLTCSTCSSIVSSSCVPPAPVCGNAIKEAGEECDPPDVSSCSLLGEGYTGTPTCNSACKLTYDSCTPPATCGNGLLDTGEQCDSSVPADKTCESVLGTGWTGSLACSSCILNKSGCSFNWGMKNLSGACSKSGNGKDQQVSFSGGSCTAEYWPIGALTPTTIKWTAAAGKALIVGVVNAGEKTKVNVPYGVDHDEVVDNGNEYELLGGSATLGVGGTTYSQKWLSPDVWSSTCTDGYITFSATESGIPASGLNVDGTPGKLPSGYGVEINLVTNSTTKAPWLLSEGPGGSGGTGGDAGAGGEGGSGTGGNAGTGSTGEAGQGGTGFGGATPTVNGDPGDSGGTCSYAYSSKERNSSIAMMFGVALVLMASRRRNRG